MPLKTSTRVRRSEIPDDYIVFLQAKQSSDSQKWTDVINDEIKSMKTNDVCDLVKLPKCVKHIGCKWIFKTKRDSNGIIKRYKAYLVAKGFI